MHIIAIIFGVLSFAAVWYFRLKMLGEVAKDGKKVAETVANLPRRMRFRHRAGKAGLDVVTDPREAATIMMLEVALARGALSEKQQAAIRGEIMHYFEFTESDANELMEQAGWMSRDAGASHVVMNRMADLVKNAPGMGSKELRDMHVMLETVASADGTPSDTQLDLVAIYQQRAGLLH